MDSPFRRIGFRLPGRRICVARLQRGSLPCPQQKHWAPAASNSPVGSKEWRLASLQSKTQEHLWPRFSALLWRRSYLPAKETAPSFPARIYAGRADALTHHKDEGPQPRAYPSPIPLQPIRLQGEIKQQAMASGGQRSMASALLFLNLIMYVVVAAIAGWAINYSIDESRNSRKLARSPLRLGRPSGSGELSPARRGSPHR